MIPATLNSGRHSNMHVSCGGVGSFTSSSNIEARTVSCVYTRPFGLPVVPLV